jgi:hypothetical protein
MADWFGLSYSDDYTRKNPFKQPAKTKLYKQKPKLSFSRAKSEAEGLSLGFRKFGSPLCLLPPTGFLKRVERFFVFVLFFLLFVSLKGEI